MVSTVSYKLETLKRLPYCILVKYATARQSRLWVSITSPYAPLPLFCYGPGRFAGCPGPYSSQPTFGISPHGTDMLPNVGVIETP